MFKDVSYKKFDHCTCMYPGNTQSCSGGILSSGS